jgi:UDP-N-acetylmuramate: L-alanyl-gamma-D-glutamyl-meso-diaminopimelate ligase
MHLHILGICGTFMGGLAQLARALGHRVSGADANVYPPMSDQLAAAGIEIAEGYDPVQLNPAPDCVVIGNAMSRGNPAVEHLLERGLTYTSGPAWLHDHLLADRWVIAVAGTHGKTTTASMVAWILEYAGMQPGFLIGGVPQNFGVSARLGEAPFFVVEADEYDTAFFDKRSKFLHYPARTAVFNNLEFDHADIFDDLAAIQRQFHHFVRILPPNGLIVRPTIDKNLDATLAQGCWTPVVDTGVGEESAEWRAELLAEDGSSFRVWHGEKDLGLVNWGMRGTHNVRNGVAAVAAANHAGMIAASAVEALNHFAGVKRRLEKVGEVRGVTVFDDFAHHPTAIRETLAAFGQRGSRQHNVIALLEPRSNTMRLGAHADQLAAALDAADRVVLYLPPELNWRADAAMAPLGDRAVLVDTIDEAVTAVCGGANTGDQVVVMSNGGFGGVHQKLLQALAN